MVDNAIYLGATELTRPKFNNYYAIGKGRELQKFDT